MNSSIKETQLKEEQANLLKDIELQSQFEEWLKEDILIWKWRCSQLRKELGQKSNVGYTEHQLSVGLWNIDGYYPENEHEYNQYCKGNLLCMFDFAHYYGLVHCDPDDRYLMPVMCRGYHDTRKHWHVNEMKSQFPHGYSRFAALVQATRTFGFQKDSKVKNKWIDIVEQLYAAIIRDEDGFFSDIINPTK